jgi:hypothetical protein
MLDVGDTVVLAKPGQQKEHLWAILTQPIPPGRQAVIVNLTTLRPGSDTTIVLQPGEHPFISHPTVVFYADARIVNVTTIQEGLRQGLFRQHSAFAPAVLKRIQEGLLRSPFTPAKIKTAFQMARANGFT